jgi:hypothetical protein
MIGGGGDPGAAIAAFRRLNRAGEEARALDRLAREPTQQRAMEQFRRAVDRAPDIRAALRDPRVLQVVATAMGIPEGGQQPGLALRALLQDPGARESLVNRLPDRRWKAAAEALRLDQRGLGALRDPAVQARLQDGLLRARLREQLEASQPGLGDAQLFRDTAAAADGPFAVLGNPVLRRVVSGALGLPKQIAIQPVETQARALQARLDLDKLKNPKEVQRLAERYLISRAREQASGSDLLVGLGLPPGGLRVLA